MWQLAQKYVTISTEIICDYCYNLWCGGGGGRSSGSVGGGGSSSGGGGSSSSSSSSNVRVLPSK